MKIAIASGKGGTGKTVLATNMASLIAEQRDVVLIDLDVDEPNTLVFIPGSPVFLKSECTYIPEWTGSCSFCGKCQSVCNFHAILQLADEILVFPGLCHSCYACSELCPDNALPMKPKKIGVLNQLKHRRLVVIESRLDVGEERAVPLISQTHLYIDKHFPESVLKLYDTPPGTSCPVVAVVKNADYIIIVTEQTPFGLHDLKFMVTLLLEMHKRFGVVINRDGIGDDQVDRFCRQENIPVLARIPNDRRIAESYALGRLVYRTLPEVHRELTRLIRSVLKGVMRA